MLQHYFDTYTAVFHNAAFDVAVLRRYGLVIDDYEDTMLMSYSIETGQEHGLEAWGERLGYAKMDYRAECIRLGYIDERSAAGFEFTQLWDLDLLMAYCKRDCELTHKLDKHLSAKLAEDERALELYYNVDLPYIEVIMEMEATGIVIDKSSLDPFYGQLTNAQARIQKRITNIIPWNITAKPTDYKGEGGSFKSSKNVERFGVDVVYNHCPLEPFNPDSDKQVAAALTQVYGWQPKVFTKTEAPKVSKDILVDVRNPLAQNINAYNKIGVIVGTFLETFRTQTDDKQILRGSFNQCIARTGRLSSSRPNLQNLPRRGKLGGEVRRLIYTPNPGKVVMWGGDLN